jgi:hypothetical protein
MSNETMYIFFPLKIISYPQYGTQKMIVMNFQRKKQ